MNIQMVIFDMAGTTIDEDNIVYKTLQRAINNFGIQVNLNDVLEIGAGQEKLNAIKDIIKVHGNVNDLEKAEAVYENFYLLLAKAYEDFDIKSMDSAETVLLELRNKSVIVVLNTGYDKNTANYILDKIKWRQSYHYDLLVTASDVKNARPAPDMIQFAMNEFSIEDPCKVVKVGDSRIDIEEGKNAHCLYSIGITTGAQTNDQLQTAKPDFIIDDLKDLLDILKLN